MRDVPQFGAFMIPVHLALTELLGFHFVFVQNCAPYAVCHDRRRLILTRGQTDDDDGEKKKV